MLRRFAPIIIVGVVVATIFAKQHRGSRDSDDRESASTSSGGAYALDVKRAAWPSLEGNSAGASALTTINYYVVFDGSGSMQSKECGGGRPKIDAAVEAVQQFFASVPANANIGLAAFDRQAISERVPLGIDNRDALNDALKAIHAGSDTPLRTAIKIGYDKLTTQARRQLGYGEYHLVVVTDGQPDPRDEDPTPIVKEILAESPVVLHTIGFCIDTRHVLNQPSRTYYAAASNPEELQQSLHAVLAEAPAFDAVRFAN